jgi:hypothetical protein
MRRTFAAILVVAVSALVGPVAHTPGATAAVDDQVLDARGSATRVVDNCLRPHVRPQRIVVTCADGGFLLRHLHYRHWGRHRAAGWGKAVTNDCTPSCAEGDFESHKVRFRFDRTKRVNGHRLFVHARMTYLNDKPSQYPRSSRFPLPR